MNIKLAELRKRIKALASPAVSTTMQWFFKTGKGEYGEGDVFAGLKVPTQRKLAREFNDLTLKDLKTLLNSPVHEERLISLFILVDKYEKGNEQEKEVHLYVLSEKAEVELITGTLLIFLHRK